MRVFPLVLEKFWSSTLCKLSRVGAFMCQCMCMRVSSGCMTMWEPRPKNGDKTCITLVFGCVDHYETS